MSEQINIEDIGPKLERIAAALQEVIDVLAKAKVLRPPSVELVGGSGVRVYATTECLVKVADDRDYVWEYRLFIEGLSARGMEVFNDPELLPLLDRTEPFIVYSEHPRSERAASARLHGVYANYRAAREEMRRLTEAWRTEMAIGGDGVGNDRKVS